jgi:antirestriction protein ArdC
MATNFEMITELADLMGYEYDGDNLKTFQEWAKEGYIVKKGEKAYMALELWKPFTKKLEEKDENGKEKEEQRFMLKMSHLFTPEQVEKGELKKRATNKKPSAKKKKKKEKLVFVQVKNEQIAMSI